MHLATYKPSDAGAMIAHYERSIGERKHIDPRGVVYNIAPDFEGGAQARYKELVDGLEVGAQTRTLADIVVTQPKGYDGDTRGLFEAVYAELAERVGEGRVVCAYVHMDEPGAQPHMHFCFVPVVEVPVMTNDKSRPLRWTKRDEQKNPKHKAGTVKRDSKGTPRYERVPRLDAKGNPIMRKTAKASEIFSKEDMRELHPDMEKALCKRLGVERVGIELEKDDAARKLSSLDHGEYEQVTAEIARAKAEAAEVEQRLERLRREEARLGAEVVALEAEAREPSRESLVESAGAIFKGRGDAGRERILATENEQLRSRVVELEGEKGQLERELPELERRAGSLEAGLDRVRGRVAALIERIGHVPDTLSRFARAIGERMGLRVMSAVEAEAASMVKVAVPKAAKPRTHFTPSEDYLHASRSAREIGASIRSRRGGR